MNKRNFISLLRKELASLPEAELNELIEDYEAHFSFGMQSGKTEEEIAHELGNPLEIAREAMSEMNFIQVNNMRSENLTRTILATIGMLFLNLMFVLPIGLTLWAAWAALCVSAIVGFVSPLLATVDFIWHQYFSGINVFASITYCGLGILLSIASYYSGSTLKKVTLNYVRWNKRVMKGEH